MFVYMLGNVVFKDFLDLAWIAFNGFQALTLSPLMFLQPALLARAGLYVCLSYTHTPLDQKSLIQNF